MKEELELQLVKKYPKILKDYRGDKMKTCMAWGLECDDGWYNLLDRCMEKVQYFCDLCQAQGKNVQLVATQIKEKYGTLRFYYYIEEATVIERSIIEDFVTQAERESEHVCEESGEDGTICSRGGWYKTVSRKVAKTLGYTPVDKEVFEYWEHLDKNENTNN
jgi:hypothetical protein